MDTQALRWNLAKTDTGFDLLLDGKVLIRHSGARPWIHAGRGEAEYRMYRGNFKITDKVAETVALTEWSAEEFGDKLRLSFWKEGGPRLEAMLSMQQGGRFGAEDMGRAVLPGGPCDVESLVLSFGSPPAGWNRWGFELYAEPG